VTSPDEPRDPFADVIGQAEAVGRLRSAARAPVHAFLLVGPPGSGKRDLARAFAAAVLSRDLIGADARRTVDLALADRHPDLVTVGAEGTRVRREEAEALRGAALRSPSEGPHKVVVGAGFDQITDEGAALLLKTVEEPPPSTIFVLLAEDVPPDLTTIASRCLRVDIGPLAADVIERRLAVELAGTSVTPDALAVAAQAAGGDLDRARVLATDERLLVRRDAWLAVPATLDGRGTTVWRLTEELLSMIDEAMAPLVAAQAVEAEALEVEIETYGLRKGLRKELDEAHKRQQRRFRTAEVRYGLALLAGVYRDALMAAPALGPLVGSLDAIQAMAADMVRNPNERLALQALLLSLAPLTPTDQTGH